MIVMKRGIEVLCGGCMLFRRSLRPSKEAQYGERLNLLSNVFLRWYSNDTQIWKYSISEEFSVKAFLSALEGNQLSRTPFASVWLGLVPLRVEIFCWLAVAWKITTVGKLRRRGMIVANFSNICVMCRKEEERINHFFLHCEVVASIWSHFIARCGIAWCCPKSIAEADQSWLGDCFGVRGRTLWHKIPFAILWTNWRGRNERVFRGISSLLAVLFESVSLKIM